MFVNKKKMKISYGTFFYVSSKSCGGVIKYIEKIYSENNVLKIFVMFKGGIVCLVVIKLYVGALSDTVIWIELYYKPETNFIFLYPNICGSRLFELFDYEYARNLDETFNNLLSRL